MDSRFSGEAMVPQASTASWQAHPSAGSCKHVGPQVSAAASRGLTASQPLQAMRAPPMLKGNGELNDRYIFHRLLRDGSVPGLASVLGKGNKVGKRTFRSSRVASNGAVPEVENPPYRLPRVPSDDGCGSVQNPSSFADVNNSDKALFPSLAQELYNIQQKQNSLLMQLGTETSELKSMLREMKVSLSDVHGDIRGLRHATRGSPLGEDTHTVSVGAGAREVNSFHDHNLGDSFESHRPRKVISPDGSLRGRDGGQPRAPQDDPVELPKELNMRGSIRFACSATAARTDGMAPAPHAANSDPKDDQKVLSVSDTETRSSIRRRSFIQAIQGSRLNIGVGFNQLKCWPNSSADSHESMHAQSMFWSRTFCQDWCNYVILPDSPARNFWDMCSLTVLLYDCILIPFTLAWRLPPTAYFDVSGLTILSFWTLDILLTFNTGCYISGDLELNRCIIAQQYLRGTFLFDLLVTAADWCGYILAVASFDGATSRGTTAQMSRLVKAQRALRVVRFLRVSTLWSRMEKLHSVFLTDTWQIMSQMLTVFFCVFLVTHFVCCFWYLIGDRAPADTGVGWLDTVVKTKNGDERLENQSFMYQYLTAYHWSVVQMFVGSTDITPGNSSESLFTILCNLFGMLFSAVITSWFSAMFVKYQQCNYDYELILKSVRRYLRQNNVKPEIAGRVEKQLSIRLSKRSRDSESDIPAFELLGKGLRAEMRREIVSDALFRSAIMFLMASFDSRIIVNLCLNLEYMSLGNGDELFQPRETTNAAFVLVRGIMRYNFCPALDVCAEPKTMFAASSRAYKIHITGSSDCTDEVKESTIKISDGAWISEAALFISQWITQGLMESRTSSELVYLDPSGIRDLFSVSPKSEKVMKAYSAAYQSIFETVPAEVLDDVSPPVDHAMVIMTMDSGARKLAAEPVLEQLRAKSNGKVFTARHGVGPLELEKEVENGECGLVFDAHGIPSRVAYVVLLKAVRSDGLILVQVAKRRGGALVPKLQMPATKVRDGETLRHSALRVLSSKLRPLGNGSLGGTGSRSGSQTLGKCTRDEEVRETPSYGMKTRFLRTVMHVAFEIGPDVETITHNASESIAAPDWLPDEFYLVSSSSGKGVLYAWMSVHAYEFLGRTENEKLLHDWLAEIANSFDNDEHSVENSCEVRVSVSTEMLWT